MWTRLRRIPISEHSGGLRQQEELGGDGGEKGDTVGVECGFCLKCVRL